MNYRGITVFQINEQIKAFMWPHDMLKDLFVDIICSKQTVSQKTTMMAKSPERNSTGYALTILLILSWLFMARGKVMFLLQQIWLFQQGFPWLM